MTGPSPDPARMTRALARMTRALARAPRFLGYFFVELVRANIVVAWEVLTPWPRMSAGIVEVPVRGRTPLELTAFAALLAITPGTLPLRVDARDGVLWVHGLHVRSPESFRRRLRRMEDHLLEVLR